jgi:transposase
MNPWPQRNSVLVMDNAPIHHGGNVAALCAARGVRLIYLPAYSPDFNPIEKGFSCLKARLRRTQEMINCLNAEEEEAKIFITCMELFTSDLCESLFRGCSYL